MKITAISKTLQIITCEKTNMVAIRKEHNNQSEWQYYKYENKNNYKKTLTILSSIFDIEF